MCNWLECDLWRKTFTKKKDFCFGGKLYEIRVPKSSSNERSHSKFDQFKFREAAHTNLNKAEWPKKKKYMKKEKLE